MPTPEPEIAVDDTPLEPWAVGMKPIDAMFVREFLVDLNTVRALMRCGFSHEHARSQGYLRMKRPAILKAIACAMQERAEALNITAKLVLAEAFRSYLMAVEANAWTAAARFLDMAGRHVDVRAFRDKAAGIEGDEPTEAEEALGRLNDAELEQLRRLHAKMAGNAPTPARLN